MPRLWILCSALTAVALSPAFAEPSLGKSAERGESASFGSLDADEGGNAGPGGLPNKTGAPSTPSSGIDETIKPSEPRFEVRSPEQLLLALGRHFKPDWAAKFRPPVGVTFKSRVQTALLAGSVVTDGYLAAQAEDSQQCRNAGKDLIGLAKNLGAQTELLDRTRSLADAAQGRDWALLRRELESTQSDLSSALRKHDDEALASLLEVGSWLRGVEIVASMVHDHYSEPMASLLIQPQVSRRLRTGVREGGDKMRSDGFLESIEERVELVAVALDGPSGTIPTREDAGKLAAMLASLLLDINTRQK